MVHEVGSFEAKTRLAELLRLAERGDEVVVLRRGHRVAVILGAARYDELAKPPGDWRASLTKYCEERRASGRGLSREAIDALMREAKAERR